MVSQREADAHQLLRAHSSNAGSSDLHKGLSVLLRIDNTTAVAYTYKQPWWDSLHGAAGACKQVVDVVPGEEYPHHSSALAKDIEQHRGHRVPGNARLFRLEVRPTRIC